jgi:hypothetical protein
MDYSTLPQVTETSPQMEAALINSLYTAFQRIADPTQSIWETL